MNTRRTFKKSIPNLVASFLMIGTGAALAADQPSATMPAPSKEMREKMASVHEQMASCLRSDKPVGDCRAQMMKQCGEMMGQKDCSMMGMHEGMMGPHAQSK